MNLLFVSHRRDVSGADICTQRIVERIKNHRILVVLPEGAFAERLRQAGIAVETEAGLTKMARSDDAFAFLRLAGRFSGVVERLRRIIRTFDADLVISNALGPVPYAGPAARLADVPCSPERPTPSSFFSRKGLVATISEAKGHHVVIEAARLLRDEFPALAAWRFVFVGAVFENSMLGAAYQTRLEQQIREHSLQDRILFAGKHKNIWTLS
jgi:glycosyltransferase involved in cell wall biosynthesis